MKVFEFSDFREFMRFCVSQRLYGPGGRKKSNLNRVSRELGYSSPSVLSMVLSGKRMPSDEMCGAVIRNWKLSLKEGEYFRTLVQIEKKARAGEDASELRDRGRRLCGMSCGATIPEATFRRIAEWHHVVIQQMVELPRFKEDPVWISQAVGGRISPQEAKSALRELEETGVLERDAGTGRLRPPARLAESTHDVPSSAIRSHQKGMIQQALVAIDDRPVSERFFNTLTLAFDSRRLPEVRKQLLELMRSLNDEFSTTRPDSVYQLCLQFFEHTNSSNAVKGGSK